jgi:hypothetical protein
VLVAGGGIKAAIDPILFLSHSLAHYAVSRLRELVAHILHGYISRADKAEPHGQIPTVAVDEVARCLEHGGGRLRRDGCGDEVTIGFDSIFDLLDEGGRWEVDMMVRNSMAWCFDRPGEGDCQVTVEVVDWS